MGPQKVMLVSENEEVAKVRWNGFRQQIGFGGDDESMEEQGEDLHREPIWAIGEEYLPPSRRRSEPAESTMILMRRLEVDRIERRIAEAEEMQVTSAPTEEPTESDLRVPATPMDVDQRPKNWRKSNPFHKKY